MKLSLVLLSLLILFAGSAYAEEDEFPIELTCYVQDGIIQFHFEETIEDSWYLFDKEIMPYGRFAVSIFQGNGKRSTKKRYDKYAGQRLYDFKEIEVSQSYIKFENGALLFTNQIFFINRLTGSFTRVFLGGSSGSSGKCYSGLEIITERKF